MRFTSPHPRDFTDDVIAAMAETANVCPSLHMPLQSGSDDVLRRMRRSYRAERYLGIIERVRAAMPDAAITTDIIVGFPGETDADFEATLDVVRAARFAGAFTFQYSKRPGTPAAELPDQVEAAVVAERYGRLVELQDEHRLGGQPRAGRPRGRGAARRGRGAQGRRHRPDVGPGARRSAGAPATGDADATAAPGRRGPDRHHPRARRTTCSPTVRCCACAEPLPATRGRPAAGR